MTANIESLGLVAEAYGMQLNDHGASPMGVLWSCSDNQQSRFKSLVGIIDRSGSRGGLKINDLGCGYGAFFDFLKHKKIVKDVRYHGYDICHDMIAAAKDRISDPRAAFTRSMVATEVADYSFASGTYNLKGPVSDGDWTAYVKDSLLQLWRQSAKGLAFNVLDRAVEPERQEWLYYADPDDMTEFCLDNFSADVVRIDGKNLNNCTIRVRRRH